MLKRFARYRRDIVYQLSFEKEKKKKTSWLNFAFALGYLLILGGAGMINPDSSRTVWIVYPYLFTFLPVVYFIMGCINYAFAGEVMTDEVYQTGLVRMKHSSYGMIFMAVVDIVLDIVYIILHLKELAIGQELLYLLFFPILIGLSVCYGKYYDKNYATAVCPFSEDEHKL